MHIPLVITRVFQAPREVVFQYWLDPEKTKKWWWPKIFTCPVAKIDFRVGGKYLLAMQGPDGNRFWSTWTYREIDAPKKIVCTDSFSDENGNIISAESIGMVWDWPLELIVTTLFEDENWKTRMTLTHEWVPPEIIADCIASWNEQFDKLDTVL
jgi:uncharacterized protein YndB with AHSA1/START domain